MHHRKPLKENLVLEFLDEDIQKSAWIDSIKCQILLQKKASHELKLWLESIENEEYIDHGMVKLFRHLHNVTQNCSNLNNTDQIFLDFSNKHLFYDDNDDEHLPISVYSGIKISMGSGFILNTLLSLGIFSTERELILNDTLRGFFRNAKLISEEDNSKSLHNYSNHLGSPT